MRTTTALWIAHATVELVTIVVCAAVAAALSIGFLRWVGAIHMGVGIICGRAIAASRRAYDRTKQEGGAA